MTRGLTGVAIVLGLSLYGCARNAIFELELDLPPQPAGASLFAAAAASDELAFTDDWSDLELVPLGPLAAACTRSPPAPACADRASVDPACGAVLSVLADGSRTDPLRVRVRFCASPRCTLPEDERAAEARVVVERAFYEARYTQATVCVDEVPTDPVAIGVARCDVRCREGTAAMQCRGDGSHFCEAAP